MKPLGYKACREAIKMTAQVAATSLGVSTTTLSSWENGKTSPSALHVLNMSRLYGVSADQLIYYELANRQ